MTMRSPDRTRPLDWPRVGAWSGSLATHVAILLIVALPLSAPPSAQRRAEPIAVRWILDAPEPVFTEPPPPVAPLHAHHRQPSPVPSTPVAPAAAGTPVEAAPTSIESAATPAVPDTTLPAPIEISAALAYETPPRPRYPLASARAREQGVVRLRVLVGADGLPERIEIEQSSGHALLDAAARDAVAGARFRALRRDGRAVAAWCRVPIAFRLDNG